MLEVASLKSLSLTLLAFFGRNNYAGISERFISQVIAAGVHQCTATCSIVSAVYCLAAVSHLAVLAVFFFFFFPGVKC